MTNPAWPGYPFQVRVSEALLSDLVDRLRRSRLPNEQAGSDWKTGTPLSCAQRLRTFWIDQFAWRGWETRTNRLKRRPGARRQTHAPDRTSGKE